MAASPVPVTRKRLGVEGNFDSPLLGNADEKVARHPEMVAHCDALARSDLELPLRGHHLRIDSGDVDTRIKAGPVMSLDKVTRKDLARTCAPTQSTSRSIVPLLESTTHQHHSSRDPEDRGNRLLASQTDVHRDP